MRKGIYKAQNGTWYIHTSFKGRTITIRGFVSKREVEENYDLAIEKWCREHGVFVINNQYEQVLNDFFEYREKRVALETLKKDKAYFKAYWNIVFANQPLNSIFNLERLKIIYNNLCNDISLTETKKYRLITCFNEFTQFCFMCNYVSNDTFNAIKVLFQPLKLKRQVTNSKRYIPISHLKALLSEINKVNDNLFALAISVLYFAGLRISEMLALTREDINLSEKKIIVQRQLQSNGKITTVLKTSNSYREVPMNNNLYELFNNININNRVFKYSHTDFRRKLDKYEELANIPNYTAHEFRHSFCTNLAMKISSVSECAYCSKVSGHTTTIFLNTYVKSLDKEMKDKFF